MKKLIDSFSKMAAALSKISGILLLIMSVGVCVHVILRGFFNSGIQGIYEFVQYTMMTIVCLTLAENELSGGNVIVNFVLDKLKPRSANIVEIFMYFLTIGGMAIVYVLAPFLDGVFRRLPVKALMAAGLILIGIFAADQIYSSIHPNEGEGITSYEAFPASREVEPW